MELNGLYHVGTLIPFVKDAEAWRRASAKRLCEELSVQVYPDGAQDELSPGYHNVALRNMLGIPRLASAYGHELPEGYLAGLEKMFAYNLWAMRPDRSLPRWNDSWHVDVPHILAQGAKLFEYRGDFLWIATEGAQGTRPDHTSHLFPWAGQVIMRSGWDRQASYLAFEVGPFGTGHQHEDKLSGNGIYETQYDSGANLRIVAQTGSGLECRVVRGQETPVVQGWMPLAHGRRGVRPIPCLVCERAGQQVEFLTLLQPLDEQTSKHVTAVSIQGGAVEVTWSDSKKTEFPWPK
jgi:hypothetical protein